MAKTKLQTDLEERGLIAQTGGGDLSEVLSKKRSMYVGVDPTADSMHVGNLVPIILMKHLSDAGYTPYLLVGGATGMIGDPRESGERQLLDDKILKHNLACIKSQMSGLLNKKDLKVLNNADWLSKIKLLDFLRDVGKHFTVNQLIKRDIIKRRLETDEDSISYTEFSYSLLQACDYLHLHKTYGVDLQIGGSDQWANIISGVDLIRRKHGNNVYALTTPMINDKTTGKKFGKSEGNAVWLDPKKTSPLTFYQFWINTADENVEEYLHVFSFTPLTKLKTIIKKHKAEPHKRLAQRQLADDMTTFVHGKLVATSVKKVTDILYGKKPSSNLTKTEKALLIYEAPSLAISKTNLKKGLNISEVLVLLDLVKSKSEARRIIEAGGVSVDTKPVGIDFCFNEKTLKKDLTLVKKGKTIGVVYKNI